MHAESLPDPQQEIQVRLAIPMAKRAAGGWLGHAGRLLSGSQVGEQLEEPLHRQMH